jgi:SP family xylose:H+ symportor-like MFS transporter
VNTPPAIIFGMLVVYFVNYFIAGAGDEAWNVETGWRWMFGSESLPAVLLLGLLFLVPESPRWLAKQGRRDEARDILERVGGEDHAAGEMAEIDAALAEESASLGQLLSPRMRVVLVMGIVLAVLQQVTGINVFLYYAPEIFKGVAGAKMDAALLQTIAVGAVNLGFTVVAIWAVDRVGRKPLMMIGAGGMGVALFAIGIASTLQAIGGWLLIFMLGYIACFALAVGPVTWVILSEIFPTKIRGRAMAIATFCLWIANFIVSQTFPMMEGSDWLVATFHHGFPFFVYGAFCVVLVLFVLRVVPETKGKSLEQIERMWGMRPDGDSLRREENAWTRERS